MPTPLFPINFDNFPWKSSFGDPNSISIHLGRYPGDYTLTESLLIMEGEWRYAFLKNETELGHALREVGLPPMNALTFPSEIVVGVYKKAYFYTSPIPSMMTFDDWLTILRLEAKAKMLQNAFLPNRIVGFALAFLASNRYPDHFKSAFEKSRMDLRSFLWSQAVHCASLIERNHTLDVFPFL